MSSSKSAQRARKRSILSVINNGLQNNNHDTNQESATPTSESQDPPENTKENVYQSSIEYDKENRENIKFLSNTNITPITPIPRNGLNKDIVQKLLNKVQSIHARLETLTKKQSSLTQSDINDLNQLIQTQNNFLNANFNINTRQAELESESPRSEPARAPTTLLFGDFVHQRDMEIEPEM